MLAQKDDADSEKELRGFVFEGMRHAGCVVGIPRVAARDVTIFDGARGSLSIPAGHTVLVATSEAAMDPLAFPEPEKINPHRALEDYNLFGHGIHRCFGTQIAGASLAATLREVFKLKNVRRAPGKQGVFTTVKHDLAGVHITKYLDASSREAAVPTSLTLHYDYDE